MGAWLHIRIGDWAWGGQHTALSMGLDVQHLAVRFPGLPWGIPVSATLTRVLSRAMLRAGMLQVGSCAVSRQRLPKKFMYWSLVPDGGMELVVHHGGGGQGGD
jgi:hypothetical protein